METLVAPQSHSPLFAASLADRLPVQGLPFASGSGVLPSLCQTLCGAPELRGFFFHSGAFGLTCLSWGVPGPSL